MRTMRRVLYALAAAALAAAPAAVNADPSSDVLAAGQNFAKLQYWHADEAFKGTKIAVDFAAPDRYRLQMPTGTQYLIGTDVYVTVGGHTMKLAMPQAAAMIAQLRSPGNAATWAKSHPVKDLGPSSVGGVATHAYGFDDTTSGTTTHDVLDVGPQQLPYRMTVNSDRGQVTITYSSFNTPVKISPPA